MWWLAVLLFALPVAHATTFVDSSGMVIDRGILLTDSVGGQEMALFSPTARFTVGDDVQTVLIRTDSSGFGFVAERPAAGWREVVIVRPVGLLVGEVLDDKQNLLADREVEISCLTERRSVQTDAVGRFRVYLSPEQCALRSGQTTAEVIIEQGGVTTVELHTSSESRYLASALLLLALAAGGIYILIRHRPFVAQQVKPVLNVKERLLVDELLLRDGRMQLSQLRAATRIPRTSLIRTLQALEHRSILLRRVENNVVWVELVK